MFMYHVHALELGSWFKHFLLKLMKKVYKCFKEDFEEKENQIDWKYFFMKRGEIWQCLSPWEKSKWKLIYPLKNLTYALVCKEKITFNIFLKSRDRPRQQWTHRRPFSVLNSDAAVSMTRQSVCHTIVV